MEEALLTPNEAAELLTVSSRTLEAWRSKGGGPAYLELGGRVRYRRIDLDEFLRRARRAPGERRPREGRA